MVEPSDRNGSLMRRLGRWLLTPWFVLGLLVVVIVFGVLITPVQPIGYSYPRLTTHAAADGGALALYLAADKLGWDVERQERPMRRGADSNAVYAVLAPPEPLTSSDVSALLGAVARGGGLLAVLNRNSSLGDSLGVNVDYRTSAEGPVALAGPLARARPDLAVRRTDDDAEDLRDLDRDHVMPEAAIVLEFDRPQRGITRLLTLPGTVDSSAIETRDPADTTSAASVAVSFGWGRGRVVVVSDPAILRNADLEESYAGIMAIRLLEHATPAGIDRLVFDEYHFGYGQRSTFFGLIGHALFGTPAGRLTLQVAAAALILLLAFAPRAIKPLPRPTIERRSPLEHVGALARAYEQVDATQTAMRRLVRGVRRRHTPLGSSTPDEAYLEGLAQRHPAIAGDVEAVLQALRRRVTEQELSDAVRALERVEHVVYPSSTLVTT
jgi:hypothetical protein